MKKIFILCSFLFCIDATAQTTFQKGYFVTKTNQQTECLIKNHDWNRIPTEIKYKTDESAEVKKIYTSQLQSFYIEGTSHMYREYNVPTLPEQKGNIVIKPGKQLLKVIAEGKASLLKNGDDIYFLHFEGQPVKPLIYTRHLSTATGREETDNSFRLELYNSLKCETVGDLRKVKYNENQILGVITRYNDCQDSETVIYADKKTETDFNLKIVAGTHYYTTEVTMMLEVVVGGGESSRFNDEVDLKGDSGNNFTAGFEAEVRLPFNHKKWAIFVAPTFNKQTGLDQQFTKKFRHNNYNYQYSGSVTLGDFSYIEVPVGIRHYFILNKNSQINIDASYGASIYVGTKPKAVFKSTSQLLYKDEVKSGFSLLRIGAGYNYRSYSFGINYYARKSFTESNSNGAISILLGYKIL